MPKTVSKEVYQFDELDDDAKDKAREWWRQCFNEDSFWSECTLDELKDSDITKGLGLEVDNIYFSGFWSQGDGACFEGRWSAKNVNAGLVHDYAPQDEELKKIALEFSRLCLLYPDAWFEVKHRGRGHHEMCTEFDIGFGDLCDKWMYNDPSDADKAAIDDAEEEIKDAARDYMRYIYHRLEKEYEWHNEDEQVDEAIIANEYEFDIDGSRA